MFEDYFTTYNSVDPPRIYKENPELLKDLSNFTSENPFEIQMEDPIKELNVVDIARLYLNSPYLNINELIQLAYKQVGIDLPQTSQTMEKFGEKIPLSDAQPGDIIYSKENALIISKTNPIYVIKEEDNRLVETPLTEHDNISVRRVSSLDTKPDYANTMYQYLYDALENNGVDGDTWAPILVAHTAIESGWGNDFSKRTNNFGGIKGKGSGNLKTKEWSPLRGYYVTNDSFQSYSSIADFADNYVKKLKYKFNAFNGSTSDYLKNIRQKGYFTAKLSDYLRTLNKTLLDVNKYLNKLDANNDLLKVDIEDLLRSEGITSINGKLIKFGNKNLRSANARYGSKNSNHKRRDPHTGNAMARDISIIGGTQQDYADFRQALLSNPRIVLYMLAKNWGIINEITPTILAKTKGTGNHFHFGPDRMAVRTWQAWLLNPNIPVTQAL